VGVHEVPRKKINYEVEAAQLIKIGKVEDEIGVGRVGNKGLDHETECVMRTMRGVALSVKLTTNSWLEMMRLTRLW